MAQYLDAPERFQTQALAIQRQYFQMLYYYCHRLTDFCQSEIVYIINPFLPGNPKKSHRQTVQTQTRRHMIWRLIWVHIVSKDFPSKIEQFWGKKTSFVNRKFPHGYFYIKDCDIIQDQAFSVFNIEKIIRYLFIKFSC